MLDLNQRRVLPLKVLAGLRIKPLCQSSKVEPTRFELVTARLSAECSTTELRFQSREGWN